jgi:hypothetical protein
LDSGSGGVAVGWLDAQWNCGHFDTKNVGVAWVLEPVSFYYFSHFIKFSIFFFSIFLKILYRL